MTVDAALETWAHETMTSGLQRIRDAGGVAASGIAVEGFLRGISDFVAAAVGPEAAYQTLQRTCDQLGNRVVTEQLLKGQATWQPK